MRPQLAGLKHFVRQRLLTVDRFAVIHGRHRGRRVGMVGRRDDDGVDLIAQLAQHLTKVAKCSRLRESGLRLLQPFLVDVTQCRHFDLGV